MYLHLGEGEVTAAADVIGVFDLDNISVSPHSRAFLRSAEEQGRVIAVGNDLPKAVVLTGESVYLTLISSSTVQARLARPPKSGIQTL